LQTSIDEVKSPSVVTRDLIAEGELIAAEDVTRNKQMAKWGGDWLIEETKRRGGSGQSLNVLTVCNTGSLATSVRSMALELIQTIC